jgi:hypothetical protein
LLARSLINGGLGFLSLASFRFYHRPGPQKMSIAGKKPGMYSVEQAEQGRQSGTGPKPDQDEAVYAKVECALPLSASVEGFGSGGELGWSMHSRLFLGFLLRLFFVLETWLARGRRFLLLVARLLESSKLEASRISLVMGGSLYGLLLRTRNFDCFVLFERAFGAGKCVSLGGVWRIRIWFGDFELLHSRWLGGRFIFGVTLL